MERWVEHYIELYARENVVTEDALNAIECLPELEELDKDRSLAGVVGSRGRPRCLVATVDKQNNQKPLEKNRLVWRQKYVVVLPCSATLGSGLLKKWKGVFQYLYACGDDPLLAELPGSGSLLTSQRRPTTWW